MNRSNTYNKVNPFDRHLDVPELSPEEAILIDSTRRREEPSSQPTDEEVLDQETVIVDPFDG